MKKKNLLLIIMILIANRMIFAQVGVGNSDPQGILDLTNTTSDSKVYPLIVPKATETAITAPPSKSLVAGAIFYDTGDTCLKVYDGIQWGCVSLEPALGGIRSGTCGNYYKIEGLATTLSVNELVGVLIITESELPQSSFSVNQTLVEGTNGEILTVKDANYTGDINGVPVEDLFVGSQYAISIQFTNPLTFGGRTSKFTYSAPLGGIVGQAADECGWTLYNP